MLLRELVRPYLAFLAVRNKPKSVRCTRHSLARLCESFGRADVSSLTSRAVNAHVEKRRAGGIRDLTINADLRTLRAILNWAVREGFLERVPVRVDLLRVDRQPRSTRILSTEEIETLLQHAKEHPDARAYGVILVAAGTGMRTDEILHLTWGDVGADVDSDGEHGFIMVTPKDGWSPKSHHKRRINVSARVLAYLRARREEVKFKGETDYVFSTRKGTPMDIQGACRAIRTVFEGAGLYRPGDALIHRIRHSYATHQIEGRTDLNTLRRILGHADIATTQRYLHATDRALREAVKSALV